MMCTGIYVFLQELSPLMCHVKCPLKTGNMLETMNFENACIIHLFYNTKYVNIKVHIKEY